MTKIPTNTDIPGGTKTPTRTQIPFETGKPNNTTVPNTTKAPITTIEPSGNETSTPQNTNIPEGTKTPNRTQSPNGTGKPVDTVAPIVTNTPDCEQVKLALNFYLEPFDSESPNSQFVYVNVENHTKEDVYIETEAYMTTKGVNYPAMIFDTKEEYLEKVEPVEEDNIFC